jgi:hypothetical protein
MSVKRKATVPVGGTLIRSLRLPFATGTIEHRRYKRPPSAPLIRSADRRDRKLARTALPAACAVRDPEGCAVKCATYAKSFA